MERKQRTQQQTEAYQASPPRIRIRPDQASLAKTDQGETAPDRTEGHPQVTAGHPRGSEGVYVISVAARLLEMHPQTLRKYERLGLVQPARTIGMLRLYSEQDLYQLRLIRHMEESLGLNSGWSGVGLVSSEPIAGDASQVGRTGGGRAPSPRIAAGDGAALHRDEPSTERPTL